MEISAHRKGQKQSSEKFENFKFRQNINEKFIG